INFFSAMAPMGGMTMGGVKRGVSFEITGLADPAHMQAVSVTFVPHGQPATGAAPQVGSVSVEVQ
ncbi:MAG TPA: hypothetical protein VHO91_01295, partial [Rhodopila sp.]|nr:hypothetical protein [Rhodopila sp.]